jgi:hypothetical protein
MTCIGRIQPAYNYYIFWREMPMASMFFLLARANTAAWEESAQQIYQYEREL